MQFNLLQNLSIIVQLSWAVPVETVVQQVWQLVSPPIVPVNPSPQPVTIEPKLPNNPRSQDWLW